MKTHDLWLFFFFFIRVCLVRYCAANIVILSGWRSVY